jgi:hypothetical protein
MFVGKTISTPPRSCHVLVGDVGSNNGTGSELMFIISIYSSSELSFVPMSGGWYIISVITIGPIRHLALLVPGVGSISGTRRLLLSVVK